MRPQQRNLGSSNRQQIAPSHWHTNWAQSLTNKRWQNNSQKKHKHPSPTSLYRTESPLSILQPVLRLASGQNTVFTLPTKTVKGCHICRKSNQLHQPKLHDNQQQQRRSSTPARNQIIQTSQCLLVPVTLQHHHNYIDVYAFLDSGSTNSYVSQKRHIFCYCKNWNTGARFTL